MENRLNFEKVIDNKNLVAETTYNCIKNIFSEEEKNNILVSKINPDYMDGIKLCEYYNVDIKMGANCLICECKRGENKSYVALLVPTGYRYNMSSTVRKYTNSRMVSVAPLEYVLEKTKMEYGSINPIGLPADWKIFIDPKVMEAERIICGSGLQNSKLSLPSKYLLKINNVEILENLAKE
ncbi:MAG: proline--tRNA ligase [Clostridia bacterium]|nr:proline--tRNA ligase [Clostridia bacterium]